MKIIAEFGILIIFFLAYRFYDMYMAIGIAIGLYTLVLAVQYFRKKPITQLELITYATVVILGGLSLFFRNELFFKWKPSIVYGIFACAIVFTRVLTKKPAIEKLLGHTLVLPDKIWSQLDYAWVVFLIVLSVLNLIIAYEFSTDLWVYFKLFGTMILLILFMICQAFWLSPHLKERGSK